MKKLSIIIPVYNVENYLAACIDSVIREGADWYEIILVNDGSTDSSPAICRDYGEKYPQLIRVINKPNGGLGSARNAGTAEASGEYILYLDSDDRLTPNALEEIQPVLEKVFDICFFDLAAVDETGRQIWYSKGSNREGEFTLEENPEILFCPPNACNKIWKRALICDNGIEFPSRLWYEDLYTTPKLYLHAEKMIYCAKAWYEYLQRSGSITNSKNTVRNLEIIDAVDSGVNYFKAQGVYEKYKNCFEYVAMFHQIMAGMTRVNLADPSSDIQDKLFDDFKAKFPNYRENKYIKTMPPKYKLLLFFVEHRMYRAYNLTMRLNNKIKGK